MTDVASLLSALELPGFPFTALDVIILAVIFFYVYEGYKVGFIIALLDLSSFVASFFLALLFYNSIGSLFTTLFSLPQGFANTLGFFSLALFSEIVLNILLKSVTPRLLAVSTQGFVKRFTGVNHWLGILPGATSALIVLSFLFSVIIALPSSPALKELISRSPVGSLLIANTAGIERKINDVFGGALKESITSVTIDPKSKELITLGFRVQNPTVDQAAEQDMFRLVNQARVSAGLKPLGWDAALRDLARDYSADMLRRGYFSHYTPDQPTFSPFDRMENAGIPFLAAGENLALAPTTGLAMRGLMNSPGHRAIILSTNLKKIGIGVMDGGIYGKMFTQEFTN